MRGKLTYQANLNTENPVGTVQSVEHVLRSLDKLASEQQNRIERTEKELADYKEQSERTFEHQARLQELLSRQIELTRMLDLDKEDQQANAPEPETNDREPAAINQAAITFMRASGASIESVAISARKPPVTGMITGKAVAAVGSEVAIATAANSFTSWNRTLWPLKSRAAISSQLDCNAGLRYSKAEWDLNDKSPGT